ncbi:hypothetical protein KC968_02465 [Candidatus Saccharibacteria bacterium]|nr:hypothetical protein [Candidatus Saccharibacteria bacterium]
MEVLNPSNQNNEPLSHHNIDDIENLQNHEVTSTVIEQIQLAHHGVTAWVAQKRMERAGNRMERMDHKSALYNDMANSVNGIEATPTETALGQPAKPRTFIERHMDKKLEGKLWKAELKKAETKREVSQFGNKGFTQTRRRDRKRVQENRETRGRKIAEAAQKRQIDSDFILGNISREERLSRLSDIEPMSRKIENKRVRSLKRQGSRIDKSVVRSANQPVLSRWRNRRRENAIESIKKHHHRAEHHKAKAQSIRTGEDIIYNIPQSKTQKRLGGFAKKAGQAVRNRLKERNQNGRVTIDLPGVAAPDINQERQYPPRPSRQGKAPQNNRHKRPARTERGRRYQEQQAINRRGVV